MNKEDKKNYQFFGIAVFGAFIYFIVFSSKGPMDFFISTGVFFGITMFLQSGDWMLDHCRLNTRRFYTNIGIKKHCSIIDDDIIEDLKDAYEDSVFTSFRPGGSSLWWCFFHGSDDIYIAKNDLIKKSDGMTQINGDWHIIKNFQKIPQKWQNRLLNTYGKDRFFKFKPDKHRIFFAENYTGNGEESNAKTFDRTQTFLDQEETINTLKITVGDLQTILRSSNLVAKELKFRDTDEKPKVKYVKVTEE